LGTAVNIKSRENRQSVISALKSIQFHLKLFKEAPANGLVIYCGEIYCQEINREKKIMISFEPFKPLSYSLYVCDKRFHTEKIIDLLNTDEKKFGFIIIDGKGVLIASVQSKSREILTKYTVDLPRKHGRGGQSSNRFQNIREEKRHNFLHKVAELAVQCFIEKDKVNVAGIILAGCAELKQDLGESNLLDPRLKEIILKYIDLSYGMEHGLNEAIKESADCLKDSEFLIQRDVLYRFFDEIARESGLYCFGPVDTLEALEVGAVKTLILWEELDIYKIKILINNGEEIILYLNENELKTGHKSLPAEKFEIKEKILLLDWLVENYEKFGADIQIATDISNEGSQFCRGFGGIGGIYLICFLNL